MKHALIRVAGEANWQVYHAIRSAVLWDERRRLHYDASRPEELMPHHHPLLLKLDGQGIGTTRLDDLRVCTGIARLVAIAASVREQGHGRVLSALVEDYARRLGIDTLVENAAADAEGFYAVTGWERLTGAGPVPLVPAGHCVTMRKALVR